MSKRRVERRQKLLDMAGGCCSVCGIQEDLEFNHLIVETKCFDLSGKALDKAWKTILEEFEKCNLLCREHHLEYTRMQYDTGELSTWNKGLHGEYLHGSPRTYHAGCRCSRCKEAKKKYRNKECGNADVVA